MSRKQITINRSSEAELEQAISDLEDRNWNVVKRGHQINNTRAFGRDYKTKVAEVTTGGNVKHWAIMKAGGE